MSFGLESDIATNGLQALEKVQARERGRNNQYQIIFMDCMMPVMDGFEATFAIRQILSRQACTIVALSAMMHTKDLERTR